METSRGAGKKRGGRKENGFLISFPGFTLFLLGNLTELDTLLNPRMLDLDWSSDIVENNPLTFSGVKRQN